VDSVELPRLDQTLLLLVVCVSDEVELGRGEGVWVDAMLEKERGEGLVLG
jgi:hypothetical protein